MQNHRAEALLKKIFNETPEGRELLDIFKKRLIMIPADRLGADLFNLGKEEGEKQFIRNIIMTIETKEG